MKLTYILIIVGLMLLAQCSIPEKNKGPVLKPLKHDPHEKKPILVYLNTPQVRHPNRTLYHTL